VVCGASTWQAQLPSVEARLSAALPSARPPADSRPLHLPASHTSNLLVNLDESPRAAPALAAPPHTSALRGQPAASARAPDGPTPPRNPGPLRQISPGLPNAREKRVITSNREPLHQQHPAQVGAASVCGCRLRAPAPITATEVRCVAAKQGTPLPTGVLFCLPQL
jgi:hypothetical protein